MRNLLAVLSLWLFVNGLMAAPGPALTCSGVVRGPDAKPLAGAAIELYRLGDDDKIYGPKTEKLGEACSGADGRYTVVGNPEPGKGWYELIAVVSKPGLALDWATGSLSGRNPKQTFTWDFKLETPARVAGTVVDEKGNPVCEAEVKIFLSLSETGGSKSRFEGRRYLGGCLPFPPLTTLTDARGGFAYAYLPPRAGVEFQVHAPGRARIYTARPTRSVGEPFQYKAGQENIRIILPLEGRIEASVVDKQTGKPVPGMNFLIAGKTGRGWFDGVTAKSDAQGKLTAKGLTEGDYTLSMDSRGREINPGVAAPIECRVQAGKLTAGLRIEMTKGGYLEFTVVDGYGKPVPEAGISLCTVAKNRYFGINTDLKGIARTRVPAGEYRLQGVYGNEGYNQLRLDEILKIEEGKSYSRRFTLEAAAQITGVVRGPDGNPVAGAGVGLMPGGRENTATDAEGKFVVRKYNDVRGDAESKGFIVARCPEKGLAAAVEIKDETKPLEVRLLPGMTFRGRVVDSAGKPISGITVSPWFDGGRWRSTVRDCQCSTDADGKYQLIAVPPGSRYNVYVYGADYGSAETPVRLETAKNNVVDVADTVLTPANLNVTGRVFDAQGKPLSGISISAYGRNQPHRSTTSDKDGKFIIAGLCTGNIQVSAWDQATRYNGYVRAKAGDQDVRIIVTDPESERKILIAPAVDSLIGRPLPSLQPFQVTPAEASTGKKILICFFDSHSRPSRHTLSQLVKQTNLIKSNNADLVGISLGSCGESELREFARKQQMTFPIGRVTHEIEKVKKTWGIQSLPWMILTDERHVVQIEGRSLAETLGRTLK